MEKRFSIVFLSTEAPRKMNDWNSFRFCELKHQFSSRDRLWKRRKNSFSDEHTLAIQTSEWEFIIFSISSLFLWASTIISKLNAFYLCNIKKCLQDIYSITMLFYFCKLHSHFICCVVYYNLDRKDEYCILGSNENWSYIIRLQY